MKLNIKLREPFEKMLLLGFPIKERRKYIEETHLLGHRFIGYGFLDFELDKAIKDGLYGDEALSQINEAYFRFAIEVENQDNSTLD